MDSSASSKGVRRKLFKFCKTPIWENVSKRLKIRGRVNPFISSRLSTKIEKKQNVRKLRMRGLPENPDKNTKMIVIETLNLKLNLILLTSDIVSCEMVMGWDGAENPRDVVITFKDASTAQKVLNAKLGKDPCKNLIIDELGKERATVWAEAVAKFSLENVEISSGAVYIMTRGSCRHKIRTMFEFGVFLRKLSWEVNLNQEFSSKFLEELSRERESSDDSVLFVKNYGSNRDKSRRQKKMRIKNLPEVPHENTNIVALDYLRSNIYEELRDSDIQCSERVVAWDGSEDPRDIVVTLKRKYIRFHLSSCAQFREIRGAVLLDELSSEMAEVWVEAVNVFGINCVRTTFFGWVVVSTGERETQMCSKSHFRSFMNERGLRSRI